MTLAPRSFNIDPARSREQRPCNAAPALTADTKKALQMTLNASASVRESAADPISMAVIQGRLESIADEMETVLLKSSYSPLVKEGLDATAALFDNHGRTLAQAEALPAHLGVLVSLLKRVATEYPAGTAIDGDVYIMNDPYDGGTHLPDILIAMPVFEGRELLGYTATLCHHQDVGGTAPGSTAPDAVDVAAEGLRIPLTRIGEAGVLNAPLMRLLQANVRLPRNFLGDIEAQIAACATGAARFTELCREWGVDEIRGICEELMSYAERLTRNFLESLPDGEFHAFDFVDDDGLTDEPVRIEVTLKKAAGGLRVDFSGTARQVGGAINCTYSSTLSAVYCAIRQATGADVPSNDGCYRPISVALPEGSVVNAQFPAPVACRVIIMKRVVNVVARALADALPDRATAAPSGQVSIFYVGGVDPYSGDPYVGFLGVPLPGGSGARPGKDGLDVTDTDVTNMLHYPTEACEAELPMTLQSLRLWEDSGGAGKYRGGLGYVAKLLWVGGEALVTIRRDRHTYPAWGLRGGMPGAKCKAVLTKADGSELTLPSKRVFTIERDDILTIWTGGGGGLDDPFERPPSLVLADVIAGRVSVDAAQGEYGVIVANNQVDPVATEAERADRSSPRIA